MSNLKNILPGTPRNKNSSEFDTLARVYAANQLSRRLGRVIRLSLGGANRLTFCKQIWQETRVADINFTMMIRFVCRQTTTL